MIEAMKQWLEALSNNRRTHHYCEDTWYSCPKHEDGCANDSEGDECNCGADEANIEIDAAITSLRQAISELEQRSIEEWESQEPDKYEMDIECTKCGAKQLGVLTVNTHPPQRKPLTDGDFLDWYDSAIWGNEDFEQCCQIAFEAGWQFAHGIKE